ncbi:MAG: hypothetical protein ABSH32_03630 [Bryobacteraceae bacterium]
MIVAGTLLGLGVAPAQQETGFTPVLQLEKPVYLADEAIRFWVGVTSNVDIPEALRSSCILHMVRPDGNKVNERVSWPIDGNPTRGWKGGWGFGKQPPVPGRYVVSFECAGQRTGDQTFEIVPNPFSGSIEARWVFFDTKSGGGLHARGAVLHIENKTGRVLRFAKPGLSGSEVFLDVRQFQPALSESTFVPQSALLRADEIPSFSFDRLEWSDLSSWPMITVPDRGSVDRSLMLQSAYSFRDGQEYEVTISSVLTLFIGERDDADAQLFPLRIPVSVTARFRW